VKEALRGNAEVRVGVKIPEYNWHTAWYINVLAL
jgi:hypothetical protein